MDFGLAGETALCTAATSGLGRASALALAAEGANVAVCGRTAEHIEATEEALHATGEGGVLAVEADITDPDHVEAFVEQTAETFGGVDHVVTSAGGPPSGPFTEMDEGDWYRAYDMLVMSVVWTLQESRPHLVDSPAGTVTAITSRTVEEVQDGLILSNAVRRGVIGLIKTVAREFAPEVRANAVLPGAHETPRVENLIEAAVARGDADSYEAAAEGWASSIPLARIGEPRELGDAVAFLASERASYITGATLAIDGGAMRS
jgi:NAD(P)-dependent dehydrogenase (short-subunit alcohol dehydrogenase family)